MRRLTREDIAMNGDASSALLTQPLAPEQVATELGIPVAEVLGSLEWLEAEGWVALYATVVAPDGSTVATSWQLRIPEHVKKELARRNAAQLGGNRAARRNRRKKGGSR